DNEADAIFEGPLRRAFECRSDALPRRLGRLRSYDPQHRPHPALAMVGNRAPEQVSPWSEPQLAIDELARLDAWKPDDPRAADATEVEVVRVLAPVDELDDHGACLHLGAREAVPELLRDHLDPGGGTRRLLRDDDHAISFGRAKEAAFGITARASTPSHCSSRAE